MLSIIISYYRENLLIALKENIKNTIGQIEYEIVVIDNPELFSLSEAYNKGAELAKFENLLFLHEDVEFISSEWGQKLIKALSRKNVGILGLAGNKRKFNLPTGHDQGIKKDKYILLSNKQGKLEINKTNEELIRVKTLDGVFLALTKDVWSKLKFDEELQGFHFYDLDISLRSSEKYENFVMTNVSLLHFSKGNFNDNWIKSSLRFHKRSYNFDQINFVEKSIIRNFWYRRLLKEEISVKLRLKYFLKLGFDKKSYRTALKFLIEPWKI